MKNIVITNGWHDFNAGDSAIIICMIKQLKKKIQDEEIEVNILSELCDKNKFFLHSIDFIKETFPDIKINLIGSPFYKTYSGNEIKELLSFFKNIILCFMPLKLMLCFVAKKDYYKTIQSADIILSKGGHFILDRGGVKGNIHIAKCLYPMLIARKMHKKYYIISQSIGPLRINSSLFSRISFKLCRNVLSSAEEISLRESVSFDHLKNLKISKNISITGDYAFNMDCKDNKKLNDISNKGKFVVFTIRQHKFNKKSGEDKYYNTMFNLANHLSEKYKLNVVFVAHVVGPNSFEDDRIAIGKMKKLDKNKK